MAKTTRPKAAARDRERYCVIKATSLEEILATCDRHIKNIGLTQLDYFAEGDGTPTDDFYCNMFRDVWLDMREDVLTMLAKKPKKEEKPANIDQLMWPPGWNLKRNGKSITLMSPETGPGGLTVERKSELLASRMLFTLADDLLNQQNTPRSSNPDITVAPSTCHVATVLMIERDRFMGPKEDGYLVFLSANTASAWVKEDTKDRSSTGPVPDEYTQYESPVIKECSSEFYARLFTEVANDKARPYIYINRLAELKGP